jgi:hypothetical protein
MHATLVVGATFMNGPDVVSHRYSTGFAMGGTLAVEPADRLRLSLTGDFLDLPSSGGGYFGSYQVTQTDTIVTAYSAAGGGLGMGHAIPVLGMLSARVWRGLWLSGGGGVGYFDSGYPKIQFIDGATGQYMEILGSSGWGPAVSFGATWEFWFHGTDHVFLTSRWMTLERDSERLEFVVPLQLGYRFD